MIDVETRDKVKSTSSSTEPCGTPYESVTLSDSVLNFYGLVPFLQIKRKTIFFFGGGGTFCFFETWMPETGSNPRFLPFQAGTFNPSGRGGREAPILRSTGDVPLNSVLFWASSFGTGCLFELPELAQSECLFVRFDNGHTFCWFLRQLSVEYHHYFVVSQQS